MKNDYGKRLKKYRLDHYLTQEEFAKQLGVGVATLKRWEYGEFKPTLSIKQKIDDLLNYAPNCNEKKLSIKLYTDPHDQLVSLIDDYDFSKFALCHYLGIDRSQLDAYYYDEKEGWIDDELNEHINVEIPKLYKMTIGLKDSELLYHLKELKAKYNFTKNSIATLADIPLHDLQNILDGKAGKVEFEVRYKLAVTLMTLKLMLPEIKEDIF